MAKPRGRPFAPGNQQSRGRPRGSRNKLTQAAQDLFTDNSGAVAQHCLLQAKKGNSVALRLAVEQACPIPRQQRLEFSWPAVKGLRDLPVAGQAVLRAISEGVLTIGQGMQLMEILQTLEKMWAAEMERRLDALEATRAAAEPGPGARRRVGSAGGGLCYQVRGTRLAKSRGRPFVSGNQVSRGRPRGSRNKTTQAARTVFEQNAVAIASLCLQQVKEGNTVALRLAMERACPLPGERTVQFPLPALPWVADGASVIHAVVRALRKDQLTATECQQVLRLWEIQRNLMKTAEAEQQVSALEAEMVERSG